MLRLLLLALPLFLPVAAPQAQTLPACTPANVETRVCVGSNICVCRITGGSLSGYAQGFRWDCGIHNGGCMPGSFEGVSRMPPAGGQTVLVVPPGRATTTTTTTTSYRGPRLGKTEVARAQTALSRMGFDPGPADGVIGPRTLTALAQYLAREGLPPAPTITPEIYRRLVP
jgi:hypothetical protein